MGNNNWFSLTFGFPNNNSVTITSISLGYHKLSVVIFVNCSVECPLHTTEVLETSSSLSSSRETRNYFSQYFHKGFWNKGNKVYWRLRRIHNHSLRIKGQGEWHVKDTYSMCRTDSVYCPDKRWTQFNWGQGRRRLLSEKHVKSKLTSEYYLNCYLLRRRILFP